MKHRVLIVDDSPFIRRMLSDWLKDTPDFDVVGTARDGAEAVSQVKELKPDIVTLDVEMPVKDGLAALDEIMGSCPTKVLMVSSVTLRGAEQTIRALELGALDFVTKPNGGASLRFVDARDELLKKLRAAALARVPGRAPVRKPLATMSQVGTDKVVVVASSTGGPKALAALFEGLPKPFNAPVLIVQHMPAGFTASLSKRLDLVGCMSVREAQTGDSIKAGQALVAPGGKHLVVGADGRMKLTDEEPIHGVRPAADFLFHTAAKAWGPKCLGVVLTGMGRDGAEGAVAIRKAGGVVLGESAESCIVYGMPRAAKDAGGVDAEFTIDDMPTAIVANLTGRLQRAS